jgi:hypothetical protein
MERVVGTWPAEHLIVEMVYEHATFLNIYRWIFTQLIPEI